MCRGVARTPSRRAAPLTTWVRSLALPCPKTMPGCSAPPVPGTQLQMRGASTTRTGLLSGLVAPSPRRTRPRAGAAAARPPVPRGVCRRHAASSRGGCLQKRRVPPAEAACATCRSGVCHLSASPLSSISWPRPLPGWLVTCRRNGTALQRRPSLFVRPCTAVGPPARQPRPLCLHCASACGPRLCL